MKYMVLLLSVVVLSFIWLPNQQANWQNGDIIFQVSHSSQCEAIKAATGSQYTHVGIIFQRDYKWYVLEAVQPVKFTPLNEWIRHGDNGHYVVKRLKDTRPLNDVSLACMQQEGMMMLGKTYDLTFEWDDDRIYCSELVWKLYHRCAHVQVGQLKKLGDFDLRSPIVAKKLRERYGSDIPLDETVIAPSDIFNDTSLVTVFSN